MQALFADLARQLETDDGDAMIAARFNRAAVDRVVSFLKELDETGED